MCLNIQLTVKCDNRFIDKVSLGMDYKNTHVSRQNVPILNLKAMLYPSLYLSVGSEFVKSSPARMIDNHEQSCLRSRVLAMIAQWYTCACSLT